MFTDAERTDIRRFCGYPAYGALPAGNMGWRFFQAYGALEYRISNLSVAEEAVVRTQLGNLGILEQAIAGAGVNLDTSAAAVWTHNPHEVRDRAQLYAYSRRQLCGFLGVPPGPALGDGSLVLVV